MNVEAPQPRSPATEFERQRATIIRTLVLLLCGLGAASTLALLASQGRGYPAAIGVCVLIALTAFLGGGGLGFLFALPRVLSDSASAPVPSPAPVSTTTSSAGANGGGGGGTATTPATPATPRQAAAARLLQSNTNLERISDWLTTMLVGVSLTQLNNVPRLMWQFRLFLEETAPVFAGGADQPDTARWLPMVGCVLLILSALAGFMAMYLYMRLELVRLFLQTERELQPERQLQEQARAEVRSESLSVATERRLRDAVSDPTAADVARHSPILARDILSVGDGLDLMHEELYEENFDRAIEIAEGLARTSAVKDPDYWLYRAAAYGQKHHSLLGSTAIAANPNADTDREAAREEVLRAAQEAIRLDRDYRPMLWALTNKRAIDNDLQDFSDDAEFIQLARPRTVRRR
jgi:hypothetical protein